MHKEYRAFLGKKVHLVMWATTVQWDHWAKQVALVNLDRLAIKDTELVNKI